MAPRSRTLLLLSLSLACCGKVTDAPSDARPDTPGDAAPPPSCDLDAPFGAPVRVPGIDHTNEFGAWLSADEKTAVILFAAATTDMAIATRGSTAEPFGSRTKIPASTASNDYGATLSPDGFTLLFNDDGSGRMSISTRASLADEFVTAMPLAIAPSTAVQGDPRLSATGLFFESDAGGRGFEIVRAPVVFGGFGTPVPVAGLKHVDGAEDMTPVPSADELTLYFLSRRPRGKGGSDIWVARRASASEPFGAPTNVTELNTGGDEIPSALSADGCRLYFTAADRTVRVAAKP